MTLEEIKTMWAKDSIINIDDVEKMDRDTVSGASLQSKYMNLLTIQKRKAVELEHDKQKLSMYLESYYKDNLYCDELKRKPTPKLAKTKEEAQRMASADPYMIDMNLKIVDSDNIILVCKEAVEYIKWNRTKDIRNYIEWVKWHNGQSM